VFAILGGLPLVWPATVTALRATVSIFEFEFGSLIPQACLFVGASDNLLFFVTAFAFPIVIAYSWLFFALSKILPARFRWTLDKTKNMSGKILNTVFVSQITFSMIPMTCYSHPGGTQKSVADYPATLCGTQGHIIMIVWGVISLLVAIGFLAHILWIIKKVPQIIASPDHDNLVLPIVFLIEDFRVESYWMILPAKAFEFGLAMVGVVEPDSTFAQIYLYLGVISWYNVLCVCVAVQTSIHELGVYRLACALDADAHRGHEVYPEFGGKEVGVIRSVHNAACRVCFSQFGR